MFEIDDDFFDLFDDEEEEVKKINLLKIEMAEFVEKEVKIECFKKLYLKNRIRHLLFFGGRGGGKSENICRSLIATSLKITQKVLCLRKVQKSIKDSVYGLLVRIVNEYIEKDYCDESDIKINTDKIVFKNGSAINFVGLSNTTESNIKSFEGFDVCFVEEASYISKRSLDILLPTIRKSNSQIIFAYNPITIFDPISEKFKTAKKNIQKIKINYYNNPYFTEELENERIDCQETESELYYNHIWLGEPYTEKNIVFNTDLIKIIQETKSDNYYMFDTVISCDVARGDTDKTCIIVRQFNKLIHFEMINNMDGRQVAERLIELQKQFKSIKIFVDTIGVGWSVYDQMKYLKPELMEIFICADFSSKDVENDKYFNKRAESYFNSKEFIKTNGLDITELKEKDQLKLLMQLQYVPIDERYQKLKIIEKSKIKEVLKESPDCADALAIGFYHTDFSYRKDEYQREYKPKDILDKTIHDFITKNDEDKETIKYTK